MYQSIIMMHDDDVMVCIQTPYLKLQKKKLFTIFFLFIVCYQTHPLITPNTPSRIVLFTQKNNGISIVRILYGYIFFRPSTPQLYVSLYET